MASARYALILDDEASALGSVALRLLRLGIDTSYAKDRDEAILWAQQEAERIHAVLFPSSVDMNDVAAVLRQIASQASGVPPSLVVIGECPDDAAVAHLRKSGVQWALWEPFDESALRWVVNEAMLPGETETSRREPRVPTTFLGKTWWRTHRKDVVISTLSPHGAFLETPRPFWEGIELTVEFPLPDGPFVAKASVLYQCEGSPTGMGVAFAPMDIERDLRLRCYVEEHAGKFTL